MATFDPEFADEYQQLITSNPGDEHPVTLTVLQAQKIVAILSAGRRGHQVYQEATDEVVNFLEAAALESLRTHENLDVTMTRSAADHWQVLDELPWPVAGPPRAQPDAP